MTWQEELRQLDEELAGGRISADDYRLRRDIVLSSAVNPERQGPAPAGPSQADSTQIIAPVADPKSSGTPAGGTPPGGYPQQQPQPPAADGSPADRTQIVDNSTVADGAERTQVSQGNWQANWQAGAGEAERTQVVSGVPPQSVAGGFRPAPGTEQGPRSGDFPAQQAPQYQQPWNSPSSDTAPPWGGGAGFSPVGSSNHDWVGQGPEAFETSSGGKKKMFGIIALVVVILLGVGAYFFFSGNGTETTTQPGPTSTAPPPPPPRPKDDLEIAKLPGTANEVVEVTSFADVITQQSLTSEENDVYTTAGAGKARMSVSSLPSNVNVLVLTAKAKSSDAAATARDKLVELQQKYSMEEYPGTAPTGVKVFQLAKTENGRALIRAHYVHQNTIVRVHVEGNDITEISKVFDEILAAQLRDLPVGD